MIRRLGLWSCALFGMGFLFGCASLSQQKVKNEYALIKDSKPMAVIVDPNSPRLAVDVDIFNDLLKKATGTKLPVVKTAPNDSTRIIFELKKVPLDKESDFAITFPDPRVIKITGTELSAGFALARVLEQAAGVEFLFIEYAKNGRIARFHVPERKDVVLEAEKVESSPSMNIYRGLFQHFNGRPEKMFNRMAPAFKLHAMTLDVFPIEKYGPSNSWPQAIMPVLNGEKHVLPAYDPKKGPMQYFRYWNPCWSNPKTTTMAIDNILEKLAEKPDTQVIRIGINDNGGCCECVDCLKAVGGKKNSSGQKNYSELYWRWVDDVANAVTAKYPHMYFVADAYREVLDPPSFKLNKNIVVTLCFEEYQYLYGLDERAAERGKLVDDWKRSGAVLGYHGYAPGIFYFLVPRVYFDGYAKFVRYLYDNNVRGTSFEGLETVWDGPKGNLIAALMWDKDTDPETFVMNWCEKTVGEAAAGYLRDYYRFWENFWTGADMRGTRWYEAQQGTYMSMDKSHVYALKEGDLAYCRKLLEKVVENASTTMEKHNAAIIMEFFEMSETACVLHFAELIPPGGALENTSQALAMLNTLPAACAAADKLPSFHLYQRRFMKDRGPYARLLTELARIIPFLEDETVQAEARRLAGSTSIPAKVRAALSIWLGGKKFASKNLLRNGSFETDSKSEFRDCRIEDVQFSTDLSADGKRSLKGHDFKLGIKGVEPGKTYLLTGRVYTIPNKNHEPLPRVCGSFSGGVNMAFPIREYFPAYECPAGKWTPISSTIMVTKSKTHGKLSSELGIRISSSRKFETYFDDFSVICVDDIQENDQKQGEQ